MVDTAAHLVERVLPAIPIRQWVLSFPYPLRLLYSTHPQAMTRTLKIVLRAIETHLIKKAGLTRSSGARSGAITFIQRFGSALNLNVHLHMLIPDGIYTLSHGKPCFHAVTAPSQSELTTLLNRIIRRITRQLTRDGLLAQEADQPYLDLQTDDTLDQFGAASLQYRVILGPTTGSRVLTLRNSVSATAASTAKPFTVARDGFSLNAAVRCQAHQRKKLERLCRYVARPPLASLVMSASNSGASQTKTTESGGTSIRTMARAVLRNRPRSSVSPSPISREVVACTATDTPPKMDRNRNTRNTEMPADARAVVPSLRMNSRSTSSRNT